jgi:hypothetical protein
LAAPAACPTSVSVVSKNGLKSDSGGQWRRQRRTECKGNVAKASQDVRLDDLVKAGFLSRKR